jgi:hypothetical protein
MNAKKMSHEHFIKDDTVIIEIDYACGIVASRI